MKLIIDEKIFEKFPETIIGVVVAKDINNNGASEDIQRQIRSEEERIRESYDPETLSQDRNIACWRQAYLKFGVKPKDAKSSVETLYKIILRGNDLRQINKLVDIYNCISLKYMLPVGGEDIDRIVGDLRLTFASGSEEPVQLLGDDVSEIPPVGEIIYRDDVGAICRRWNWREAERTKLTENTKNAILVIESVVGDQAAVESAIKELSELVQKYCGGKVETCILNSKKIEAEL